MRQIGRIFLDAFEAVHAAVFVRALTCIFNSPILKWLREFKKRTERQRPPGEMRVWGDERASFWVFLLCASSPRHRTPPTESAAKPSLAIIKATQQHQIIMNNSGCAFCLSEVRLQALACMKSPWNSSLPGAATVNTDAPFPHIKYR